MWPINILPAAILINSFRISLSGSKSPKFAGAQIIVKKRVNRNEIEYGGLPSEVKW